MRKQIVGLLVAASIAPVALVASAPASGAATTATSTSAGHVSVAASRLGGKISRKEVIQRAAYWYQNRSHIPYNGGGTYRDIDGKHRYRRDCSGYVSMALHLAPTGLDTPNTAALPRYGVKLKSRKLMQMGDFTGVLGPGTDGPNGHVRLFEKWANKAKGTYWAYDFGSTPVKHKIYSLSTDMPRGGIAYTAYRYKNII